MKHPAVILALCACVTHGASATSAVERDLGVWTALIAHGLAPGSRNVVIADETTGDPSALGVKTDARAAVINELGLPPAAFDDWVRRNHTQDPIAHPLKLEVSYQVLSAKLRAELFADVAPALGWQQFDARFPDTNGWIRLSHVGFSDDYRQALVYLEHQCGATCGTGHLFRLDATMQGSWIVADGLIVWMVK
jgi:hypothetical protein